ncbi:MAG: DNA-directed RNA polymerase subunit alpha [Dehalococcoidia bacterium]|nr:DNA-directed RNA polymerase subunit alpha [Dehalococcoidia bacterium]
MSEIVMPQIECAEISDKYGRFITEPLERGSGITMGNAMRRALLSALAGAAVTWIRIEGLQHEFSTVPYMKEDTIDFLLKVKAIRLRPLSSRGGQLILKAEGEGHVLAGDIEPSAEFEVANPELHLATLDSPEAKLIVEFNVEQGKGYRPASQGYRSVGQGDGLPLGVLPLDAVFTPVRKVNYNIENISVGQISYERLILDVWTDGTISPVDAVSRSAHLLIEQLQLFYELARVTLRVGEKQPRLQIPLEQYNMPIEELDLSVRTFNCLKRAGITKAGELFEKSEKELLNIKNFGQKTMEEVMGQLRAKGFVSEEGEEEEGGQAEDVPEEGGQAEDVPEEDV